MVRTTRELQEMSQLDLAKAADILREKPILEALRAVRGVGGVEDPWAHRTIRKE